MALELEKSIQILFMNCFSQLYYIIIYCPLEDAQQEMVVANSVKTHHHHATDFPLGLLLHVPPFMISSLSCQVLGQAI